MSTPPAFADLLQEIAAAPDPGTALLAAIRRYALPVRLFTAAEQAEALASGPPDSAGDPPVAALDVPPQQIVLHASILALMEGATPVGVGRLWQAPA